MDTATVNQLISTGGAIFGSAVGATAAMFVAYITSKRAANAAQQKEKRAQEIKAAEDCSTAFSALHNRAIQFARSDVFGRKENFLENQRRFSDAFERMSHALIHAPKSIREQLIISAELLTSATDIGSYGKHDGTHYDHPFTIIEEANKYTQSVIAANLHGEPDLELSPVMQEYKIGLADHDRKQRDEWEQKSEGDIEQAVFDGRRGKWLAAHPSFKEN